MESCQPIRRLEDVKKKKKNKKTTRKKKETRKKKNKKMVVQSVAHNLQFTSNYLRTANVTWRRGEVCGFIC